MRLHHSDCLPCTTSRCISPGLRLASDNLECVSFRALTYNLRIFKHLKRSGLFLFNILLGWNISNDLIMILSGCGHMRMALTRAHHRSDRCADLVLSCIFRCGNVQSHIRLLHPYIHEAPAVHMRRRILPIGLAQ